MFTVALPLLGAFTIVADFVKVPLGVSFADTLIVTKVFLAVLEISSLATGGTTGGQLTVTITIAVSQPLMLQMAY
jgi:hypothetical protein